jgi:hypothetical protein
MKTFVVIMTMLSCWAFFMFTGMAMLVRSDPGCLWYGLGLVVSGVVLKLEMDAWLR